jgi:hypothetical protein
MNRVEKVVRKPGIPIIHWTLVTLSQPPRWKLSTQTHHHKNNGPYSSRVQIMAIWVVEFSNGVYKIGKIFAKTKGNYCIL